MSDDLNSGNDAVEVGDNDLNVEVTPDDLAAADGADADFEAALAKATSGKAGDTDGDDDDEDSGDAEPDAVAETDEGADDAESEDEEDSDADKSQDEAPGDADGGTHANAQLADSAELGVSLVTPEAVVQAQEEYAKELDASAKQSWEDVAPRISVLKDYQKSADAKIIAFKESLKDESEPNGERAPTLQEWEDYNALKAVREKCQLGIEALEDRHASRIQATETEKYILANQKIDPRLKAYDKEFREFVINKGIVFDDFDVAAAACEGLRKARGGKPVVIMKPEDVKAKALEKDIERKSRAKITAGAKSSPSLSKSAKHKEDYFPKDTPDNVRSYLAGMFN